MLFFLMVQGPFLANKCLQTMLSPHPVTDNTLCEPGIVFNADLKIASQKN